MKHLLLALSLFTTTFAMAQSFVLQDTGRLLSIDRLGNLYDLTQNVAPDKVKLRGKNWLVTKEGMITISADGLVDQKPGFQLPKIKEHGASWMIGDKSQLVIVANDGTVYTVTAPVLDKAKLVTKGGNFFTIRNKDKTLSIITMDLSTGNFFVGPSAVMMQQTPGLNINNIKDNGGNWFTDSNGRLYVVTANGGLMSKKELGTYFGLGSQGGNFFRDTRGGMNVVLDNGLVLLPNLPLDFGQITKTGSAYGWNTRGDFFTFAESAAANNAAALTNQAAMNRLLSEIVKKTIEQPDPRTLSEEEN